MEQWLYWNVEVVTRGGRRKGVRATAIVPGGGVLEVCRFVTPAFQVSVFGDVRCAEAKTLDDGMRKAERKARLAIQRMYTSMTPVQRRPVYSYSKKGV